MLNQLLESIGLTDKESASYLTLLSHGTSPTSFVANKAGLNRGTAYVALHALLEKGLVTKTSKRKVQYFTAQEPAKLVNYLDRRKKEIDANRIKLESMLGEFEALISPLATHPRIEFFSGREGARTAFEDTLFSKEKTLRAFLSVLDLAEFLGDDFFDDYTARRIKAGYTLHAIRTLEKDRSAIQKDIRTALYMESVEHSREVRYVSEDFAFPLTLYLYDHKVTVISSKKESFAVTIESAELAEMQKKIFSVIWSAAKRSKEV